ncbi:head GIN domain-containing protein [Hydrotalea sp.]|uniref:head GIN domain-containing protein n=1 Tax=Hydrotalea sp. TaxID=2881279 RepID=UPI003D13FDC2
MKPKIQLYVILASLIFLSSACNYLFDERINGNGHIATQQRTINGVNVIKAMGDFNVVIEQDLPESLSIEADDNIIPYILTNVTGNGTLEIKAKEHYRLNATEPIRIRVKLENLEGVYIIGSGSITGNGKFSGAKELHTEIAGSGKIKLSVNTPSVTSKIAGMGTISLDGETKDETISIAGSGTIKCADLKAENVNVKIAGSGSVNVFAENKLDVHIAGSGSVNYSGNATVTQNVAGSGNIRKTD